MSFVVGCVGFLILSVISSGFKEEVEGEKRGVWGEAEEGASKR